jgi:hypothetical protein
VSNDEQLYLQVPFVCGQGLVRAHAERPTNALVQVRNARRTVARGLAERSQRGRNRPGQREAMMMRRTPNRLTPSECCSAVSNTARMFAPVRLAGSLNRRRTSSFRSFTLFRAAPVFGTWERASTETPYCRSSSWSGSYPLSRWRMMQHQASERR